MSPPDFVIKLSLVSICDIWTMPLMHNFNELHLQIKTPRIYPRKPSLFRNALKLARKSYVRVYIVSKSYYSTISIRNSQGKSFFISWKFYNRDLLGIEADHWIITFWAKIESYKPDSSVVFLVRRVVSIMLPGLRASESWLNILGLKHNIAEQAWPPLLNIGNLHFVALVLT